MSDPKRLLVVAYLFPPSTQAGVHRTVRFVRYLTELEWRITVLTADHLRDPLGGRTDENLLAKIPSGVEIRTTKVFRGFDQLLQWRKSIFSGRAAHDDLQRAGRRQNRQRVVGRYDVPSDRRSLKQRLKDFITDLWTVPDRNVGWLPYAVARGVREYRRGGFDVIYTSGPPHTGHLVGYLLKKLTGRPLVTDFRDPWARSPWKREAISGTFRGWIFEKLENRVVACADHIILNTFPAAEEFRSHYGHLSPEKFSVIPNGFDPADFETDGNASGAIRRSTSALVITHTGALYRKRNPETLLRALEQLLSEGKLSPAQIKMQFVGTISEKIKETFVARSRLAETLEFVPPVTHSESLGYQARSDILLIVQPDTAVAVPGKLFEYIAMRKRILALAGPGATADIIRTNALGYVVHPEDIEGAKTILLSLVKEFEEDRLQGQDRATQEAYDTYNGRRLTLDLDRILGEVISQNHPENLKNSLSSNSPSTNGRFREVGQLVSSRSTSVL